MTSRFDAVVFDLFGTLVPEFPRSEFYEAVAAMATVLGCDPPAFRAEWERTAIARQTGAYAGGMAENVREICTLVGADEPSEARMAEALELRLVMYRRWFHPRAGALETLSDLSVRGYPVALISMCAPDTPPLWRASELASLVTFAVFSSETGLRKPDAAIYLAACDGIGVTPERCLYCGDGAYGELTGAQAVGMTAYEIRDPEVVTAEQLRPEGEDWTGANVADLRDLLELLPPRS